MNTFQGNKVVLLRPIRVPVKEHASTSICRKESYHNRIQKKWNKRYGLKLIENPAVASGEIVEDRINKIFYMHENTFHKLNAEINR